MKRHIWFPLLLSAAASMCLSMPVYAGSWEKGEDEADIWRYREDDGSYISSNWKEIDGIWYYFDENCVMVTGTRTIDGKQEEFGEDGAWQDTSSGVVTAGSTVTAGGSYVAAGPGAHQWKRDDRGWYYEDYQGNYAKDTWMEIQDVWYYFDSEGYMMENAWVDTDGRRYRTGGDGAMLKGGTYSIDGVDYTFEEDGSLAEPPKSEEELQAEALAAKIVASITSDDMTKPQKASAIYGYVRANMTYSYGGPRPDVGDASAAIYAFRRHSGNCYEYYAMSRYLLEAAGMPNIRVTRASDGDHFWNLVDVDGTWYHFDTTPRRNGGTWCLVTTGQLRESWSAHNFDVSAYPATP